MKCAKVQTRLSSYIDRGLPPDDEETVRNHLNYCARCRREHRNLSKVRDLLHGIEEVELDPDRRRFIWNGLQSDLHAKPFGPLHRRSFTLAILASGIVFSSLLLTASLVLLPSGESRTEGGRSKDGNSLLEPTSPMLARTIAPDAVSAVGRTVPQPSPAGRERLVEKTRKVLAVYPTHQNRIVMRQDIAGAKRAGIDGLLLRLTSDEPSSRTALQNLLLECKTAGLQASVLYETTDSPAALEKGLTRVLDEIRQEASFLRVQRLPVLFVNAAMAVNFKEGEFESTLQRVGQGGTVARFVAVDAADPETMIRLADICGFFDLVSRREPGDEKDLRWRRFMYREFRKIHCGQVYSQMDDGTEDVYQKSWTEALQHNPNWVVISNSAFWMRKETRDPFLLRTRTYAKRWKARR